MKHYSSILNFVCKIINIFIEFIEEQEYTNNRNIIQVDDTTLIQDSAGIILKAYIFFKLYDLYEIQNTFKIYIQYNNTLLNRTVYYNRYRATLF